MGFAVEDAVAVAATAVGSTGQAAANHSALTSADAVGDAGAWSAARGADLAGVKGSEDISVTQRIAKDWLSEEKKTDDAC